MTNSFCLDLTIMDEPQLREIITTLVKKLVPKFEVTEDPIERIRLVLEDLDYDKFVADLGLSNPKDEKDYPRKNIQVNCRYVRL